MKKNPNWPRVYLIRRNAESAVLENGSKKELETWFKKHPPVSPQAVLAYADLLLARKEWEKAVPMLHALWNQGDLSEDDAKLVQEKLSLMLDERDFQYRAKKLLNDRKPVQARKLFPLVDPVSLKLDQARADLISNASSAKKKPERIVRKPTERSGPYFRSGTLAAHQ